MIFVVGKKKALSSTTQKLVLIGGFGLVIGPFLPWLTDGGSSTTGVEYTNRESLILTALGVYAVCITLLSIVRGRNRSTWAVIISALLGGGISCLYAVLINRDPTLQVGFGVYVCLVASSVLIMGSVLLPFQRNKPS